MYELTKVDKFNIQNLLSLRGRNLKEDELQESFKIFLQMEPDELGSHINKILHAWEGEWLVEMTGKEKKLFNYCEDLIERLIASEGGKETEIIEENITKVKGLENIHPDIYSHISRFYSDGHYATAVEESYKITRKKLVALSGKEKAHEAFQVGNYEIMFGKNPDSEAERNFFEGIKFLHMSIQNFRNEKAHTPAKELDKKRAIHYIYLASLALELISR